MKHLKTTLLLLTLLTITVTSAHSQNVITSVGYTDNSLTLGFELDYKTETRPIFGLGVVIPLVEYQDYSIPHSNYTLENEVYLGSFGVDISAYHKNLLNNLNLQFGLGIYVRQYGDIAHSNVTNLSYNQGGTIIKPMPAGQFGLDYMISENTGLKSLGLGYHTERGINLRISVGL